MKVGQLLSVVRDEPIAQYIPEAAMIMELIHDHTKVRLHMSDFTGKSLLEHIEGLPENVSQAILNHELNDGLDLRTHQKSLQKVMAEKNRVAQVVQVLIVLGMCFLLTATTLVYLKLLLESKSIPTWELTLIIFGGPIAVIWNYQGVLNSQNKDFLFAVLGRTPPGNMISTLVGAVRGNSRQSDGQYAAPASGRPPPPPTQDYG